MDMCVTVYVGDLRDAQVANYPFTTLVPNLGVYEQDYQSIVLADIPVCVNTPAHHHQQQQ